MRLASTPFLAFLDCDDEYARDHLSLRLSFFENDPELALVAGGLRAVGPRSRQYIKDARNGARLLHASQCVGLGGTFLLRRRVFDAIGGFFENTFLWDYDAWQRIKHAGYKITCLRQKTLIYHCEGDDRLCWKARQNDVPLHQVTL